MSVFYIDTTPAPINFECGTRLERVLQNAKNLLMARMGEVPYDRRRGLNPDVYDKPISFVREHIEAEIRRVLTWEPNVQLVNVEVQDSKEGAVFKVTVEAPELAL